MTRLSETADRSKQELASCPQLPHSVGLLVVER
nr:MAG TPA: hypothetical protein [Caudoviricetes sp.]